ncbi:hypothetical protein Tco_0614879 [Tanacetum coccineum]
MLVELVVRHYHRMDWLGIYAVIVCDEKIMRIPYGDEVLIVQGDRSGKGKSRITKKETKDKSEEKRLEDVPTVQDFPESFQKTCLDYRLRDKLNFKSTWSLVQLLGHVIDSEGIHVDPAKIESIKDWASPKTSTEICQFLGLAGYYTIGFIECFLKIYKPMKKLTQKYCEVDWMEKAETVFSTVEAKYYVVHRSWLYPKTDGQSERTIQTWRTCYRACVIDFGKGWDDTPPLVKFSYINRLSTSIKAATLICSTDENVDRLFVGCVWGRSDQMSDPFEIMDRKLTDKGISPEFPFVDGPLDFETRDEFTWECDDLMEIEKVPSSFR